MVVEKLQHHELFRLLTPKEVDKLSSASGVMKLSKGERVYGEGMPASHLFVLLKGKVEMRRPAQEELSILVEEVGEGGVFGVSSLTGGERYLLNAECVQDSEVLKMDSRVLHGVLENNPATGYAIQKRVSQIFFKRYVDAMDRLRSVALAVPIRAA
jgi:signal-transduction protein with cAMP-binding, CBS, and nucleotidyltransferase domain